MIKTKGLGRGLSALLGDSNNDEKKKCWRTFKCKNR